MFSYHVFIHFISGIEYDRMATPPNLSMDSDQTEEQKKYVIQKFRKSMGLDKADKLLQKINKARRRYRGAAYAAERLDKTPLPHPRETNPSKDPSVPH